MYDRDMHAYILSSGPYCMSLTRYLIIRSCVHDWTLAKTRAKQDHRTCSRHSRKKKEKRKKMDNRTCLPRVELINAWRSGYFYARGTRAIPTPCACPAMLVYATCDDLGKQLFSVSVPCSIMDKD